MTPLETTKWVVEKYGLFEDWVDGATVLDPTAGDGNFLEAFILLAREKEVTINRWMLKRLFGIEREKKFIANFRRRMRKCYGLDIPEENFYAGDFILSDHKMKADIIVGNPPWQNFNELPDRYKERLKPYFFTYHLAENPRALLLGGSRIDIAALVIAKSLTNHLVHKGKAFFFLPLSIFLNDLAHRVFRKYALGETKFAVKEIYDFEGESLFDGVATRYGFVAFQRDAMQEFPVPYFVKDRGSWVRKDARPLFRPDDPLSVGKHRKTRVPLDEPFKRIKIALHSKPRQGVNTCGANDVFIFDRLKNLDEHTAIVGNKNCEGIRLPTEFLFPLTVKDNFTQHDPTPRRYVLIPHNAHTGKPLELFEIEKEPLLQKYLNSQRAVLQKRKGVLINAWIARGYWWALLGVGKYSFSHHKVMWEAYGKKRFLPKVFSNAGDLCWQGNQSLHAYIPLASLASAKKIQRRLQMPFVEKFLSSHRMEGTCNWAQPGRISRLLEFVDLPE
ncbi:MAG TPA: SAM-dependent DNA methyltransferase [Bacteroidota bacterium]|nr:SAM-dependent DNA methyltransferase [Bacteroidota bacterium]